MQAREKWKKTRHCMNYNLGEEPISLIIVHFSHSRRGPMLQCTSFASLMVFSCVHTRVAGSNLIRNTASSVILCRIHMLCRLFWYCTWSSRRLTFKRDPLNTYMLKTFWHFCSFGWTGTVSRIQQDVWLFFMERSFLEIYMENYFLQYKLFTCLFLLLD